MGFNAYDTDGEEPRRQKQFRDNKESAAKEIERLRKADAVWRQKYSLLESQIANCHKEMKKLREALLSAPPRS